MLCEVQAWGNLWGVWATMTALATVALCVFSGGIFWQFYVNPTYNHMRPSTRAQTNVDQLTRSRSRNPRTLILRCALIHNRAHTLALAHMLAPVHTQPHPHL